MSGTGNSDLVWMSARSCRGRLTDLRSILCSAPSLEGRQSRPSAAFQDRRREHGSEVNSREIDL
jgi:hypothetical protein